MFEETMSPDCVASMMIAVLEATRKNPSPGDTFDVVRYRLNDKTDEKLANLESDNPRRAALKVSLAKMSRVVAEYATT